MPDTYTIEDNVSQIDITYTLAKIVKPLFYFIITSSVFQVFVL